VLAGQWARATFNGVQWQDANAGKILADTGAELVLNEKRGQVFPVDLSTVFPVDLSTQPDIATLLSSVDTTEIGTGQ
jgi:hypothetical protein